MKPLSVLRDGLLILAALYVLAFPVIGQQGVGLQLFKLAGDYTNSSTTGTEITGIGPMTVDVAGSYSVDCLLIVQSAVTATAPDFGVNYTGTVTEMVAFLQFPDSATAATAGIVDGTVTGDGSEFMVSHGSVLTETTTAPNLNVIVSAVAGTENYWISVKALLTVSDTGDIELWGATDNNTSAITVQSGSYCAVLKLP